MGQENEYEELDIFAKTETMWDGVPSFMVDSVVTNANKSLVEKGMRAQGEYEIRINMRRHVSRVATGRDQLSG